MFTVWIQRRKAIIDNQRLPDRLRKKKDCFRKAEADEINVRSIRLESPKSHGFLY